MVIYGVMATPPSASFSRRLIRGWYGSHHDGHDHYYATRALASGCPILVVTLWQTFKRAFLPLLTRSSWWEA